MERSKADLQRNLAAFASCATYPSRPTSVQKSQFRWALRGLRALEHNRLAVFCRSDVSHRKDSRDRNSEAPIAQDGAHLSLDLSMRKLRRRQGLSKHERTHTCGFTCSMILTQFSPRKIS